MCVGGGNPLNRKFPSANSADGSISQSQQPCQAKSNYMGWAYVMKMGIPYLGNGGGGVRKIMCLIASLFYIQIVC